MGYETPDFATSSRTACRAARLVPLVVGLFAGVILDRALLMPNASNLSDHAILATPLAAEPAVLTRENYARIKPGMTSWEVGDILGPGSVARERGTIVRPDGMYEEFHREPGLSTQTGGRAAAGTKTRVERTIHWQEGTRSVDVVFLNDLVESKGCDGIF